MYMWQALANRARLALEEKRQAECIQTQEGHPQANEQSADKSRDQTLAMGSVGAMATCRAHADTHPADLAVASRRVLRVIEPAPNREYIPLRERTPLKLTQSVHEVAVTLASLKQPVGLPRHMSPRPQPFEEPCQWNVPCTQLPSGDIGYGSAGLQDGGGGDRDYVQTDLNIANYVHVSRTPVTPVSVGGGRGEAPQIASRLQLGTPLEPHLHASPFHAAPQYTHIAPQVCGAGLKEPVPPSTGPPTSGSGAVFSNRRVSKRSQEQGASGAHSTHGLNHGMPSPEGVVFEDDGLRGLMDVFFPAVNANQPNNRKLPAENDRWGFGGSSRSCPRSGM